MKTIFLTLSIVIGVISMSVPGFGYEQAYPKTAVGQIELKELPAAKLMVTKTDGEYFTADNGLFMRLFRYINSNQVAMTIPVEAEFKPAAMRFYVGPAQQGKELNAHGEVKIVTLPKRTVLAVGARGAYSWKNIVAAQAKLTDWLTAHQEYVAAGEAYGVFWNSPFMPGFLKRFEIHVAVNRRPTGN